MEIAVALLAAAVAFMALWIRAVHVELRVLRSFTVAVSSFALGDARKADPKLDWLMNNIERAEWQVSRRHGRESMN